MSFAHTLVVRILAEVRGYKATMDMAAKDTADAAAKIEQSTDKASKAAGTLEEKLGAATKVAGAATGDFVGAAQGAATLAGGAGVAAVGVGVLVAGLAAAAYAAHVGAQEEKAYEKALILSGNAAGTTAGQLQAMAGSIDKVVGTHYQAAAALAQMAGTGQVAAGNLQKFSQTAVEMERTVGQSVSDTVKEFAELGREPVKASLKLNEGMNYLTAATFAQIKAAEDLGDSQLAASLAQNAYADATASRTAQIKASLGLLARAWRGLGDAAGWAWDRMLDLGRERGPETTLEQQKNTLANLELLAAKGGTRGPEIQKQIEAVKLQMGITKESIKFGERAAQIQADWVVSQKAGIEFIKMQGEARTKQEKTELAIERIRTIGAQAGKSEYEIEKLITAERAKAAGGRVGKADNSAARELEKEAAILATLTGVNADYEQQLERLQRMRAKGVVTEAQYVELVTALIAKQPVAGKQMAEMAKFALELAQQQEKVLAAAFKSADSTAAQADAQEAANAVFGLGKSALADLTLAQLEKSRADLESTDNVIPGYINALDQQIAAQKRLVGALKEGEVKQAGAEAAKDAETAWKKAGETIEKSLTDSLMRGFEAGKSFGQNAVDTLKNMFNTLVLRPVISAVMNPVAQGLSGALGLSGTANAGSGGGGLLGGLSNLSSLNTMGNLIGNGFASTVGSSVGALFGMTAGNTALGTTLGLGASSSLAAASAASVAGGGAAAGAGLTSVTTALAAIGPVGWAAIAAIAVAGIFGGRGKKEATGGGIEGSFSGEGFAGNNFSTWKQKGGWFHNDRTGKDTSALDAATAKQFGDAYGAVQQSATQAAASLGLSADAITNYSQSISLQLGTDAAANEKAVAALFAGIGDNMALAAAPGIALLSKEGEAAGETMARLSTSITTANAWLSILRQRLFQVSLAGGDAASKLADAFGGLENLSAASKSFYETYYTEGERAARSQEDMTRALALVNLAMPTTKDGLRELAGSLDLNTEAGRTAYAVLLTIAPEFAAAADLASKFSQEMAAKLVKTFSGNGQLVPALDVAALKTVLLSDSLLSTYAAAGSISVLFLDVNSGLLTFGDRTSTLTGGLTGAQLAALALTGQIDALHQGADRTRIDFVGLSAALQGVDTETFANTVALVFDSLAARIGGVIDGIGAERIAVREAALQIIDPTVMGQDAIVRAIGAINVNAPNNAALIAAQQALGNADAYVAAQKSGIDYARSLAPSRAAMDAAAAAVAAAPLPSRDPYIIPETGYYYQYGDDAKTGWAQTSMESFDQAGYDAAVVAASAPARAAYDVQVAAYGNAVAVNAGQIAAAQDSLNTASTAQAAAVTAARNAQTAYIASLQDFSIDASKAVGKLGKLREETVKYYDAQKQLADLMGTSAASLRTTVADYRYSQLTDAQQFDKLQADFAKNYAMGLSTDGETLAGYGDKLNAGLNPLLEKAKEVLTGSAYDAFAATALARAEAIAGRLETLTPTDYAADSLAMLGQIDATLAALDASSKSAEKIISDAVTAGADKTANGLRALIAAVTGQAIPAFAAGGAYQGGLALVGERGPEFINFSQPGQVYTAQQTRGMFAGGGGNTARLEALVERQARQLENLSAELRAIAISNSKIQRLADREESEGKLVRNDADTPLFIKVVA